MIKAIDHIIIHSSTPYETMAEIEEFFGIKAHIPVHDLKYFKSGVISFLNLDIEVLGLGNKKDFKPYFYGIAFESESSKWKTITELSKRKVEHSLPIFTKINYNDTSLSWSVTLLKGLLDSPISAPYSIGFLTGNNWLNRIIAQFNDTLMGFLWVRKLLSNNTGKSMSLFCHYHNDTSCFKNKENNGGNFNLDKVAEIVIEKRPDNNVWNLMGAISDKNSAELSFVEGKANRIKSVVLVTKNKKFPQKFILGDACFEFKQA